MNLFRYNQETQELELEMDIIMNHPAFKTLMKRRKASKYDTDGSNKVYNKRELLYVFLVCDPTSNNPLHLQARQDREESALEFVNFEDIGVKSWSPDKKVRDCIEAYDSFYEKIFTKLRLLNALKDQLSGAAHYFESKIESNNALSEKIAVLMEQLLDQNGEMTLRDKAADLKATQDMIEGNFKAALDMINKIDESFDRLDKLTIQLLHKESRHREVVGGGKPYNREIPNT